MISIEKSNFRAFELQYRVIFDPFMHVVADRQRRTLNRYKLNEPTYSEI